MIDDETETNNPFPYRQKATVTKSQRSTDTESTDTDATRSTSPHHSHRYLSGRFVLRVLVAVALIAALGVGAYVLFSGDDSSGEPEAVAMDFIEAGASGECETAVDLMAPSSIEDASVRPEDLVTLCEAADGDVDEAVSATVVSEEGDRAVVATEVQLGEGGTGTVVLELIEDGGEWGIDYASVEGVLPSPTVQSESASATTTAPPTSEGATTTTTTPASDVEASRLACMDGSLSDCDALYGNAEVGSLLETLAETCGGLDPSGSHQGNCEEELGAGPLEASRAGCSGGSMADCDALYEGSQVGSELETLAETCGGLDPSGSHQGNCEEEFGADPLEELRAGCSGGSMADCDALYRSSRVGSELETLAETCAGRDPSGRHQGNCEEEFG